MKKLLPFAALFAAVAFTSCVFGDDDDDLWKSVHGLENRIAKLEELCKQMNTNISSLQTIVTALQKNDYVTGVTPVVQDGKEVGYTITFSKSNPITIYHGKDGQDGENGTNGKDGATPAIGVKQDTDGIYYWTLNGDWLTDEHGGKIKAEGTDGVDGSDGEDGTNGKDGITPQFKIENDYWFISYDNGNTWTQLGKAAGEDGKDGEDGADGDSMFTSVDYKTSTDYVIFTLADGTQIKLPTWSAFEALQRLCNETNTNLSALQMIVTALQNNDYITSVDPLTESGKVVGYTIKFAKSNPIVIYSGKNGADGVDGNTPVIGVKKDTDGIYYWTLDGEFIVVDGQKIKAQGTDGNNGADGSNGNDGQDGANGEDGVTPKLEIREGYWYVSYDNGTNWTQLGKATGEDGKDGDSIRITQDENNVYFELADGTVITIPKTGETTNPVDVINFEDPYIKTICLRNWDINHDEELSFEEAASATDIATVFTYIQTASTASVKVGNDCIRTFDEFQFFTGITNLNGLAFTHDINLSSIRLPENIKTIQDGQNLSWRVGDGWYRWACGCFANTKIKSIELPKGIKLIGEFAFWNCIYLENIYIQSITPPTIKSSTFGGISTTATFYVPMESVDTYKNNAGWKQYASQIVGYNFTE